MSAVTRLPDDLLRDSEEVLRLVDALLEEFRGVHPDDPGSEAARIAGILAARAGRPGGLRDVSLAWLRAHREVEDATGVIRQVRDSLEAAAARHVRRLRESPGRRSAIPEPAAPDMLDSVSHALELLDRLDPPPGGGAGVTGEQAQGLLDELREQLFLLIGCLQFQDIPWQRLGDAVRVLRGVERRLDALTELLETPVPGGRPEARGEVERPR